MDSFNRVLKYALCNRHVMDSLNLIERSISNYGLEKTCISFNGGKDCTAVLHLVHSILIKAGATQGTHKLTAFYAQLPDHFKEESEFVDLMSLKYDLKLIKYSTNSLKESLVRLKADVCDLEAIFIGTRNDDLGSDTQLQALAPTDPGWPQFMRINPILEWTYAQVWDFIKELDIPYCDLYNQGYSSIGTKNNTVKNSSLLRVNENGEYYYLPAWSLEKSNEERLSRSSSLDVSSTKYR